MAICKALGAGVKIGQQHSAIKIVLLHPLGSYILEGINLLKIDFSEPLSTEVQQFIQEQIEMDEEMSDHHYLSGFAHLTEVAIKALSSGINDPATAIFALHSLTDLFAWLLQNKLQTIHTACKGKVIITHCHPAI